MVGWYRPGRAGVLGGSSIVIDMSSTDRSWQTKGLCRGNHSYLFFPPSSAERKEERERREHKAKAICTVCPVKVDCLEFALEIREPYGIWGGLTETERRQVAAHRPATV
jgi:WhiB family redox-sensing transcriptional regulator